MNFNQIIIYLLLGLKDTIDTIFAFALFGGITVFGAWRVSNLLERIKKE
jgi:hypothetical protein